MRFRRDFAVTTVPVEYKGCRCLECWPAPPTPDPTPEPPVVVSEAVLLDLHRRVFGPSPDPPELNRGADSAGL